MPMGPMPPQGAPSPSPQGAPTAKEPPMSGQQSLLMIHKGFESLSKLLASASDIPNEIKQSFNDSVTSFQALAMQLGQGGGEGQGGPGSAPQSAPQGAPMMAQHANPNAKPAGF